MIRISYWGSPAISAKLLQALAACPDIQVCFVVSQEDRPRSSRGREMEPTPVKAFALQNSIPVFTPASLKKNADDFLKFVEDNPVDFNVVFAYGKIIPQKFFDHPRLGTVNFHASLLPKLRGASPIEHALFEGLPETGWTLQRMVAALDAGDVYFADKIVIEWRDDFFRLLDKLMTRLLAFAPDAIRDYAAEKLTGLPQDEAGITHCGKIDSSMGKINWSHSALTIRNLARGLSARGGIHAGWNERNVKIFPDLEVSANDFYYNNSGNHESGSIAKITQQHIWIACGENTMLPVAELQPEGKKRMAARDFVNGYRVVAGQKFF